jgi:hypothetical protein
LLSIITISSILQCYLALAFLVIIPLTSSIIFSIYRSRPRGLLLLDSSSYNCLILVAKHINTIDWIVFFGESIIVNSLLNRPLELKGLRHLRLSLACCILSLGSLFWASGRSPLWHSRPKTGTHSLSPFRSLFASFFMVT